MDKAQLDAIRDIKNQLWDIDTYGSSPSDVSDELARIDTLLLDLIESDKTPLEPTAATKRKYAFSRSTLGEVLCDISGDLSDIGNNLESLLSGALDKEKGVYTSSRKEIIADADRILQRIIDTVHIIDVLAQDDLKAIKD
jgi:hypothetical protein